jgi:hypothetical protein
MEIRILTIHAGHCAKSILRGEPAFNEESHTVREFQVGKL